jgi:hypothetical protein
VSVLSRIRRVPRQARFNTERQHFETWQERAEDAVALWLEHRGSWRPESGRGLRIADFGAGNERLRQVLRERLDGPFAYFPYDLHPQRRTTIKFNVLEDTPAHPFDLVFVLGLFEYLPPGNTFLERLGSSCRDAVVSYVFVGSSFSGGLPEREALGWRAHDDRETFERSFTDQGFTRLGFRTTNQSQTGLWVWEHAAGPPAG